MDIIMKILTIAASVAFIAFIYWGVGKIINAILDIFKGGVG